MPSDRPEIAEILARLQADYSGTLPDADPLLPRSVILAELNALSAGMHELNGRLARIERNQFADLADLESLEREGSTYGLSLDAGTKASGTVNINGVEGTSIPIDTFLVDANETRYITTAGATIPVATVVEIAAEAVEVGSDANIPAAAFVDLEEPIDGVTAGINDVATAFEGGAPVQEEEDYRDELLAFKRRRPQGGTLTDFDRWVFEALPGGVTRAHVIKPTTGTNLVNIYPVDDAADAAGNAIALSAGDMTIIFDYIDADHRRPLCGDVQVQAPTFVDLDPAITLTPNTAAVQAAVTEEIIQLLIREATISGTLTRTHLTEVISRAAGETDSDLTSPAADVTVTAGQLLRIGTPVYS